MNIHSAIVNVMSEIGAIGKNKKNTQQGFMYRGVDDVMNVLQPLLVKHKIFIVPEVLEQTREDRTTNKGNTLIYSVCKIKYTFFADDGSNITAVVIGEGMDSGDKATNKAMAIAFKYACFQVFCIPTEEMDDPDAESHELGKGKTGKAPETVIKATKEQITEIFRLGKQKEKDIQGYSFKADLEKMAADGNIKTSAPYGNREGTIINWTVEECEFIKSQIDLPF
jgi:hypothetical protein